MARPRENPITPTLRRLMALAGCGDDLAAFAKLHGISVHTVRNWDGRGGVPMQRLAEFAAQYQTTVDALTAPDESNERHDSAHDGSNEVREPEPAPLYAPKSVASGGMSAADRDRVITAMNIIQAGVAAEGLDATKLRLGDMAGALIDFLPAPIPRTAPKKH